VELIGANIVANRLHNANKIGTPAKEASLMRHDSAKLAKIIVKLID
jgi:hypothetical protein